MNEITLQIMTREQCRELYKGWENDPAIYMNPTSFQQYQYEAEAVDRYYDAKQGPSRVFFAIVKDGRTIGELHLKSIDRTKKECTLSIHMQNDAVKGRGYGTKAEQLALEYGFTVMDMNVVCADAIVRNTRSQHVLEKVGFTFVKEENGFRYYRCEREKWALPSKPCGEYA